MSSFKLLFFLLSLLSTFISWSAAESHAVETGFELLGGSLEWPSTASFYNPIDNSNDDDLLAQEEDDDDGDLMMSETRGNKRRSVYYYHHHPSQRGSRHYYISYAALSANRIPCPARSGRSYYTHNCYNARGPARPYVRGCSAITRCRM